MINLDRFAYGTPDSQNVAALARCQGCGGEIYPGDDVYTVDGYILHKDPECLVRYIGPRETTIEEVLGRDEAC